MSSGGRSIRDGRNGCNLTRVLNFLLLPLYTSNPGDMSWVEVWFPLELAVIQKQVLGQGT